MMRRDHVFGKKGLTAAVVGLAAAALLVIAPSARAQGMGYESGGAVQQTDESQWYDPSDWFDTEADLDYENDWYDFTYNYPDDYYYERGYRGYFGFGEIYETGDGPDAGYDYNYYTENWFETDLGAEEENR